MELHKLHWRNKNEAETLQDKNKKMLVDINDLFKQ